MIRCRNPFPPRRCPKLGLFFGHEKEKERKIFRGPCFFQTNLSFHNGTLRPGRFLVSPALKQDWMKKKSRKSYCKIFVHPFILNLEKLKFPPKQKKTIPWIFLLEMVRLSVGELRDSFGRALLGTNMALPKKGRWSWDMLSRKIHLACQRKILARHFLNPMVLIQPKLSKLLGLEEVPWGFTKEMRFCQPQVAFPCHRIKAPSGSSTITSTGTTSSLGCFSSAFSTWAQASHFLRSAVRTAI